MTQASNIRTPVTKKARKKKD